MSGKNLKNFCQPILETFTRYFGFALCSINYLSFILDAETTYSHGTDGIVNRFMKFESNEEMDYVERIHEERSIFNKILESYFHKKNFNQKLKLIEETEGGIFLFYFHKCFL